MRRELSAAVKSMPFFPSELAQLSPVSLYWQLTLPP